MHRYSGCRCLIGLCAGQRRQLAGRVSSILLGAFPFRPQQFSRIFSEFNLHYGQLGKGADGRIAFGAFVVLMVVVSRGWRNAREPWPATVVGARFVVACGDVLTLIGIFQIPCDKDNGLEAADPCAS